VQKLSLNVNYSLQQWDGSS